MTALLDFVKLGVLTSDFTSVWGSLQIWHSCATIPLHLSDL